MEAPGWWRPPPPSSRVATSTTGGCVGSTRPPGTPLLPRASRSGYLTRPCWGATVRAGLDHSTSQGRLPFTVREPWKETGLPAQELGYFTLGALEHAGVLLVQVSLKGQRLRVTPMRHEGAGRGYAGSPSASATIVDRSGLDSETEGGRWVAPRDAPVIDGSIGAVVLQAVAALR